MAPGPLAALLCHPAFGLLARGLLILPYGWSGAAKLADPGGAQAEVAALGLGPAGLVVALTILVQLGSSALILLARGTWLAAGALGVFTLLATLIAHAFWTVDDPALRFQAQNTFLEHLGLIGGLMLVAALDRERT